MSKHSPVTPAIRFLREHNIPFSTEEYVYDDHGGTAQAAQCCGIDEHKVIKTIIMQDEQRRGMAVLMHGDREISAKNLARLLGVKSITLAPQQQAQKWTGYLFGGTGPFGMKTPLPVYAEASIFALDEIIINGGRRGFQLRLSPQALHAVNAQAVKVSTSEENSTAAP